jgi:hypothetical protein
VCSCEYPQGNRQCCRYAYRCGYGYRYNVYRYRHRYRHRHVHVISDRCRYGEKYCN